MLAEMSIKRKWLKKSMWLLGLGLMISFLMQAALKRPAGVFLSDLFFTTGSVFLLAGLWGIVRNMGAFNSMKYGTKSVLRMLRGQRDVPQDKMLGGFLEYVQAQPRDLSAPWTTALAVLFILISICISFVLP